MEKKQKEDHVIRMKILEEESKAAADAAAITTFSDKDNETARQKIADVAWAYDRARHPGGLKAFDCVMDPVTFKDQLKRNFGVKVSAAELGALLAHFDKNGDGTIEGSEFLMEFFKIGTFLTPLPPLFFPHENNAFCSHNCICFIRPARTIASSSAEEAGIHETADRNCQQGWLRSIPSSSINDPFSNFAPAAVGGQGGVSVRRKKLWDLPNFEGAMKISTRALPSPLYLLIIDAVVLFVSDPCGITCVACLCLLHCALCALQNHYLPTYLPMLPTNYQQGLALSVHCTKAKPPEIPQTLLEGKRAKYNAPLDTLPLPCRANAVPSGATFSFAAIYSIFIRFGPSFGETGII
jgi:hypothetical protein